MAGFNAASVVEALDWTFEPFVATCAGQSRAAAGDEPPGLKCAAPGECPNGPDPHPFIASAKGVVREPTDKQIAAYLSGIKAIGAEVKAKVPDKPDSNDPADLMAALDDLDLDSVAELTATMAAVVAALCSGNPSKDTILALPPRRRTMFYGWLQQEVMSPNPVAGDGNAQVRTLRSAAAG